MMTFDDFVIWARFLGIIAFMVYLTWKYWPSPSQDQYCEHCDNIQFKNGMWVDTCKGHDDTRRNMTGLKVDPADHPKN